MTVKFSDYGCGIRAKIATPLDEDDLNIGPSFVPSGGLNLVRPVEFSVKLSPRYDAGDWDTNATSDNQLFDVKIDMICSLGQYSGASDEDEDFGAGGPGYYTFRLDDIPLTNFDVDCSAWTTENLIEKILTYAIKQLDNDDIPGADPGESRTESSYSYDETPAP